MKKIKLVFVSAAMGIGLSAQAQLFNWTFTEIVTFNGSTESIGNGSGTLTLGVGGEVTSMSGQFNWISWDGNFHSGSVALSPQYTVFLNDNSNLLPLPVDFSGLAFTIGSKQALFRYRADDDNTEWYTGPDNSGSDSAGYGFFNYTPVPEPSSFVGIAGVGLAAFAIYRRNFRK